MSLFCDLPMVPPRMTPTKSFLQGLMALCMAVCFVASGHPVVVSLGQEAACCADDVCGCTSPAASAEGSCCSVPAADEAQGCCGGSKKPASQPAPEGPAWQSRCFCGGDGPVVVVLGSPVRFDAHAVAVGLVPKAPNRTPRNVELEPESRKPEPKGPVPWKKWS